MKVFVLEFSQLPVPEVPESLRPYRGVGQKRIPLIPGDQLSSALPHLADDDGNVSLREIERLVGEADVERVGIERFTSAD